MSEIPGMPQTKAEKVTYGSYLKVPQLLSLQQPLSRPEHRDELLFIMSHQVYELWFKQALHELEGVCQYLDADNTERAINLFERVHVIQHLLIEQIALLETMFGVEFNKFRDNLRPASGFQSVQFRLLEFISNAKNPRMAELVGDDPSDTAKMRAFLARPTIFDHLLRHLARRGVPIPADVLSRDTAQIYAGDERVAEAIAGLYRSHETTWPLFRLCEHFLQYDELLSLWRFHHVKMVERMIGGGVGTGGSSGAKYLMATVSIRLFPDLWAVRDRLGATY
ncbi:MAG: tryptophan 2,3-dioxygenase [Phycisphaerales bacterium]